MSAIADPTMPIAFADVEAWARRQAAIREHNGRIFAQRMALMRRNMLSGSGFHAHGAPQLLDAKWSASDERETRGTFRVDTATAQAWQRVIKRQPLDPAADAPPAIGSA